VSSEVTTTSGETQGSAMTAKTLAEAQRSTYGWWLHFPAPLAVTKARLLAALSDGGFGGIACDVEEVTPESLHISLCDDPPSSVLLGRRPRWHTARFRFWPCAAGGVLVRATASWDPRLRCRLWSLYLSSWALIAGSLALTTGRHGPWRALGLFAVASVGVLLMFRTVGALRGVDRRFVEALRAFIRSLGHCEQSGVWVVSSGLTNWGLPALLAPPFAFLAPVLVSRCVERPAATSAFLTLPLAQSALLVLVLMLIVLLTALRSGPAANRFLRMFRPLKICLLWALYLNAPVGSSLVAAGRPELPAYVSGELCKALHEGLVPITPERPAQYLSLRASLVLLWLLSLWLLPLVTVALGHFLLRDPGRFDEEIRLETVQAHAHSSVCIGLGRRILWVDMLRFGLLGLVALALAHGVLLVLGEVIYASGLLPVCSDAPSAFWLLRVPRDFILQNWCCVALACWPTGGPRVWLTVARGLALTHALPVVCLLACQVVAAVRHRAKIRADARSAVPLYDLLAPEHAAAIQRACRRLDVRMPLGLGQPKNLNTFGIGMRTCLVKVPDGLTRRDDGWPPDEVRALIFHELYHCARYARAEYVLSTVSLAVGGGLNLLPSLLDTYRRELSADEFAVRELSRQGMDPGALVRALRRLQHVAAGAVVAGLIHARGAGAASDGGDERDGPRPRSRLRFMFQFLVGTEVPDEFYPPLALRVERIEAILAQGAGSPAADRAQDRSRPMLEDNAC